MEDFLEISATDAAQMRKVAVKWCVVDATASLVAQAWSTTCVATNCSEGCVVNSAQHLGCTRNWCACIPYVNQVVPETKHRNVLGS